MTGMDAPTEADSQRDGVLSYALEWHALIMGLGAGLASGLAQRPELLVLVVGVALGIKAAPTKKLRQLKREPWYAIGGTLIGYATTLTPFV